MYYQLFLSCKSWKIELLKCVKKIIKKKPHHFIKLPADKTVSKTKQEHDALEKLIAGLLNFGK